MNHIESVMKTFEIETSSIESVMNSLDESLNEYIDDLYRCKGSVVFTGMGKSGHICVKIVSTMQSLGIRSVFLHPAEAMHGDLGFLSRDDIVIALSNSGETKEILDIIPSLKIIGVRLFCIVGRAGSSLESESERSIVLDDVEEAYLDGMVPTSSTTCMLVLGDAIAVALAEASGFNKEKFSVFHPHGQLGRRMTLKVSDIMVTGGEIPTVLSGSTLDQVVFEMCKKPVGGVCIVDSSFNLLGVMTDGDLRRLMNSNRLDLESIKVDDVMKYDPITVNGDLLVYEMVKNLVSSHEFSFYPVVDMNGKVEGTLRMIDIVKSGLMKS